MARLLLQEIRSFQDGTRGAIVVISRFVYWIAAGDRAHGQADAREIEALRSLWRAHRVVDGISPFDGASFWVDDGRAHARVIRMAHATASHPVEAVDVDPSSVGMREAGCRQTT